MKYENKILLGYRLKMKYKDMLLKWQLKMKNKFKFENKIKVKNEKQYKIEN